MTELEKSEAVEKVLGGVKPRPLKPRLILQPSVDIGGIIVHDWDGIDGLHDFASGDYMAAGHMKNQLLRLGYCTQSGQPTDRFYNEIVPVLDETPEAIESALKESSEMEPDPYVRPRKG